jgi:hypothetical protein
LAHGAERLQAPMYTYAKFTARFMQ